jgi:hypothetical protein
MQKSFEPNKTKPIDYVNVFREHICKTLNRPQEWPRVEATFAQMDQIRNSFDWKALTQSEHFNQPIMRTLQDSMEEYLRYEVDNSGCVSSFRRSSSSVERAQKWCRSSSQTG